MSNKSKIIGIAIYILCLLFTLLLLFIIPKNITTAVTVTAIFTILVYISLLIVCWLTDRNDGNIKALFYKSPIIVISGIYLIFQFVICIITAFTGGIISTRVAIALNLIPFIILWIVILALCLAKDYIKKIDSRQKDNHIEL